MSGRSRLRASARYPVLEAEQKLAEMRKRMMTLEGAELEVDEQPHETSGADTSVKIEQTKGAEVPVKIEQASETKGADVPVKIEQTSDADVPVQIKQTSGADLPEKIADEWCRQRPREYCADEWPRQDRADESCRRDAREDRPDECFPTRRLRQKTTSPEITQ